MKALVCEAYGPVENLVYRDLPDPVPGAGEILVAVRAIGVNFPDGLLVEGKYQARPACPFAPGSEVSGDVIALGAGVNDFQVGDRVLSLTTRFGAYAEKIALPAAAASKLPPFMNYDQGAALLGATGTAHHALRQRGRLQAGETLVVLGAAGGTGCAAVQIGKAIGARVIAVCSSDEKIAFAKAQGADAGINYSREDLNQAIKRLTDGRGADVVYDAVGGDAFDACSRAMAWDGRLLIVGFASGRIPTLPVNLTLVKGYSVIGVFWGAFTEKEPAAHAANMRELFGWIETGQVKPVIDAVFPLKDGIAAIKKVTGRNVMGKVIVKP
ncbi:MAG: NADPH:quinone oxidoreductase family protein [Gammaproteobacteria bacterium]|nr:NADPH:quinone oxidoreductase family protein [Gammaproteobacteria bacterium]